MSQSSIKVLEKTHVHGLSELGSLGILLKAVWLFCLVGAFCGGYLHCTNLVNDARSEQIRTYVENYQAETAFPKLQICPMHLKYDEEKLKNKIEYVESATMHEVYTEKRWEFEKRLVRYMTSMETLNYFKAIVVQGWDEWSDMKDIFWDDFIANGSYTELEMELTRDFDKVVVEMEGFPLINKRKVITALGVCYAFQINSSIPLALANTYSTQFALPRDYENTYNDNQAPFFVYNADPMIMGEPSFWPQAPWESIYQAKAEVHATEGQPGATFDASGYWTMNIKRDYHFDLLISSITFNRVNRRSQPCRNWSEQDQSICMVQCFNDEFCSKMPTPCLLFHPNQTKQMQYKRLCSLLDDEDIFHLTGKTSHCVLQPEVIQGKGNVTDICKSRCPARCVEQVYYVTHSRADLVRVLAEEEDEEQWKAIRWANVTLRFQDFNRRLIVHEHLSWKRDTFAATFASAISLWTGVSGLAVAQITMIMLQMVSRAFHRKRIDPSVVCVTTVVFLMLLGLVVVLAWTVAGLGEADDKQPVLQLSADDLWDVPASAVPAGTVTIGRVLGCFCRSDYWESGKNRPTDLLTDRRNTEDLAALPADKVNVNTCAEFCKGYNFMGIRGGECSCGITGDVLSGTSQWSPKHCSLPCPNVNATIDDCEAFGCAENNHCDGTQCCGGLHTSGGHLRFTSIYVLHSCTTSVTNANPTNISAWVNQTSNAVTCQDGFALNGPQILHCNSTRAWEEEIMPTCE